MNTRRLAFWARRVAVVAAWIAVVVAWRRSQDGDDLGAVESAQRFVDTVGTAWWGVLAYVGVYLVRPLVLFPASVLTVVAGVLFGPLVGVSVVVVAANASALVAYGIGHFLGRVPGDATHNTVDHETDPSGAPGRPGLASRWAARLRSHSFETVLVMRLVFLPFDLVSYLSGALRIRWRPFLLATALGSLPGTVSFVLLGASLERLDDGLDGLDPVALVASVGIFLVSLAGARFLRRRDAGLVAPDHRGASDVVPARPGATLPHVEGMTR